MEDNDLISRSALLDVGSARKIIEVIGNWDELSLKAKSACTRLGVAHKKMISANATVIGGLAGNEDTC